MCKGKGSKRKYHFCPFEDCIKPVKKLTQHLERMHPEVSHSERLRLSKASKCAPGKWARKPRPQPPTQKSITCFFSQQSTVDDDGQDHEQTAEDGRDNDRSDWESNWSGRECDWSGEEGDGSGRESKSSSREDWMGGGRESEVSGHQDAADPKGKPFFALSHPFLVGLDRYLQSRHGRGRSAKEARQICSEVSRYLFYADRSHLQEGMLLNAVLLDNYLSSLEGEVKASTQNAKLNRIRQGISYLTLSLDQADLPKAERVFGLIRNWAGVLATKARRDNRERLEDKSEQPAEFGEIDKYVQCQAFHRLHSKAVESVKKGTPVSSQDLHTITVWLAGVLLHTNHQRPSAICSITLHDFNRAKTVMEGHVKYTTIRVVKHKTGTTGSAFITISGIMCRVFEEYVKYLHPLHPSTELLLPNSRGKLMDHLSRYVAKSGMQQKIHLQIATENRSVGATQSARVCSSRQMDQVATQMSHSKRTQQLHYVSMKNREEAREGYKILADVRQGAAAGSGQGKRRRPFTTEETETIELYFESYIEALDNVSLPQCREFLRNHPLDRDVQQIRDKVRHLVKLKCKELAQSQDNAP